MVYVSKYRDNGGTQFGFLSHHRPPHKKIDAIPFSQAYETVVSVAEPQP